MQFPWITKWNWCRHVYSLYRTTCVYHERGGRQGGWAEQEDANEVVFGSSKKCRLPLNQMPLYLYFNLNGIPHIITPETSSFYNHLPFWRSLAPWGRLWPFSLPHVSFSITWSSCSSSLLSVLHVYLGYSTSTQANLQFQSFPSCLVKGKGQGGRRGGGKWLKVPEVPEHSYIIPNT